MRPHAPVGLREMSRSLGGIARGRGAMAVRAVATLVIASTCVCLAGCERFFARRWQTCSGTMSGGRCTRVLLCLSACARRTRQLQLTSNSRFCAGVSTPMLSLCVEGCTRPDRRGWVAGAVDVRSHLCHTDVGAICFLRRSTRLRALRPLQHTQTSRISMHTILPVARVPGRSLDGGRALVQKSVVHFFLRKRVEF